MAKAEKGNWDDFNDEKEEQKSGGGDSNNGQRKINYTSMSEPGEYKVRLVGSHVKFRKRFKPYRAQLQDGELDNDPAYKAGHPMPRKYACNIINKTGLKDGEVGRLEVLEKGPSVFKNFANYKSVFGEDPAGKKGPDFLIKVTIPKDDKGKYIRLKTEYTVTHLDKAPFTEEEVAMIKEQGGLYDLSSIYRSTPTDKLEEMWNNLSPDEKKPPKKDWDKDKKGSSEPKVEADDSGKVEDNMEDSPADSGDDLFEDKESDGDAEGADLF